MSKEKAHELAERFRALMYEPKCLDTCIQYALGISNDEEYPGKSEILRIIADKIETIAEPDGIPYPLDKDGTPIKLGDEVYYDCKRYMVQAINSHIGGSYFILIQCDNDIITVLPYELSHKIRLTLDDILKDIPRGYVKAGFESNMSNLIKEAYNLGKKEASDE